MKIPCEDCICLAICKAESYQYDTKNARINPRTYNKCNKFLNEFAIKEHISVAELLDRIRFFFRPGIDFFC